MAFVGTKNETAHEAVTVSLDEIRRMTTELVTEKELSVATDGILNSEVFNFDTKREILDRQVLFEMYGYPETFLDDYRVAIQGMTAEKVREAAANLWKVDDMSILVVGNPADFDGDLGDFGPVNDIDITIPEPEWCSRCPTRAREPGPGPATDGGRPRRREPQAGQDEGLQHRHAARPRDPGHGHERVDR